MRAGILEAVRRLLLLSGFYVSTETDIRPVSFDIVARRDSELLIIKVLANVDSLSLDGAAELRNLAFLLNGNVILVGERSSSRDLEDGAVYVRHGVPILNLASFEEYLIDGVQPLVYAAPGGFYVSIDGERLKGLRAENNVSLGELAQAIGVSRRAIAMYEEGMGAMVEVAAKIEEFFEADVVMPVDPFSFTKGPPDVVADLGELTNALEREVYTLMRTAGLDVHPIGRSPFNAISRDDRITILTGIGQEARDLQKKAAAIANLCDVTERMGAFFVERLRASGRVEIEGTPLISKGELSSCAGPDDILLLIEERRRAKRPE